MNACTRLPTLADGMDDNFPDRLFLLWWFTPTRARTPAQEKPGSRAGQENQDTIWHLWRLNDFLLGVGLCPTGKSQKTGRENYIRENVYVAHLAPSLFFLPCK